MSVDERVQAAMERFRDMRQSEWLSAARTPAEVRAVLLLRGLTVEELYVRSLEHLKREERFNAIVGYASERGSESAAWCVAFAKEGFKVPNACSENDDKCIWHGPGPCSCAAPEQLNKLRQRQRAMLWAAEALMRDLWTCSGCG